LIPPIELSKTGRKKECFKKFEDLQFLRAFGSEEILDVSGSRP